MYSLSRLARWRQCPVALRKQAGVHSQASCVLYKEFGELISVAAALIYLRSKLADKKLLGTLLQAYYAGPQISIQYHNCAECRLHCISHGVQAICSFAINH